MIRYVAKIHFNNLKVVKQKTSLWYAYSHTDEFMSLLGGYNYAHISLSFYYSKKICFTQRNIEPSCTVTHILLKKPATRVQNPGLGWDSSFQSCLRCNLLIIMPYDVGLNNFNTFTLSSCVNKYVGEAYGGCKW